MAVTSGFFNSSNGDRRYTAEQFSALIDNLITDGVFATVGTAFSVEASGSAINIGVGRAWFNSVWVYNDASLPLAALSAEQLQNRIDAVVIEINHTESVRAGSIKMVRGTPANTPTNPTLVNTESVHQYPLAYIYRPAGQSEVLAEDITNMIGTSACPFVTGILQTINIESLFAQWQGEFDTWFSGLEDMLDGDQATALAARILDLEGQMRDLAMERAVYDVLSDSSDDDIQDSTGAPIEVATRFSETSSGGEIVPATPTADGFKVGDFKLTGDPNQDQKWLLANGESINRGEYPDFSALYPTQPSVDAWFVENIDLTSFLSSISPTAKLYQTSPTFSYVNGRYVFAFFVRDEKDGTAISVCVAYSETPGGPWTLQKMTTNGFSVSTNSSVYFNRLRYVNGYYMFVGSLSGNANLFYSTDLVNLFQTQISSSYSSYNATLWDITFFNQDGKYYAVGRGYNRNGSSTYYISHLYYSTDLTTANWPYTPLGNAGNYGAIGATSIGIFGDRMIVTGLESGGIDTADNRRISRIFIRTSYWNGTSWVQNAFINPSDNNFSSADHYKSSIVYDSLRDDYYIIFESRYLFRTHGNPATGWTRIRNGAGKYSTNFGCNLALYRDKLIWDVCYSNDPDALYFRYRELPSNTALDDETEYAMDLDTFNDGYYLGVAFENDRIALAYTTSSATWIRVVYNDPDHYVRLPSISLSDDAYTFVKVKE